MKSDWYNGVHGANPNHLLVGIHLLLPVTCLQLSKKAFNKEYHREIDSYSSQFLKREMNEAVPEASGDHVNHQAGYGQKQGRDENMQECYPITE